MKVLVFPRDVVNPYQELLYREIEGKGATVTYLPMPTRSQTLNLFLIPLLLAIYRVRGYRILHIHWVYSFSPSWVGVIPFGRRAMQLWFRCCLRAARLTGYRIVWTAHNLLPLGRVFADDLAARKRLIASSSAVIAHSGPSIPALHSMGAKSVRLIPVGSYAGRYPDEIGRDEARRQLSINATERVIAFVGAIHEYKGIDELLKAVLSLPPDLRLKIVIAGFCNNVVLRHRIEQLAEAAGSRVQMRLEYIPDDQLQKYFRAADAAVLPFLRITNSGSLHLALTFGLPTIVPQLPELSELPDAVVIRYRPGVDALAEALSCVARMTDSELSAMSAAAKEYAASLGWQEPALQTLAVYQEVLAA